jgi:predicted DNA-binding protein YlxM (UPF0122 family)
MTEPAVQRDFDANFWAELIEALPQAMPLLEKLTTLGRSLMPQKETAAKSSPYSASTQNQALEEVCTMLHELLQGDIGAEGKPEKLFDPYSGSLKAIERHRRRDVFAQFERYKDKFRKKTWQTIVFYYLRELSEKEIARKFGIGRSAVSNRLKRARDKKDKLDKDRRREAYEELRKQKKDDV